ncbi:hypothetical protein [Pelosinus propionicus]|uniref:Uncharacterized protein n=1 Tax=Pelosinus propionicus DSM 13327 TaxID=1123291 RepID=A0A1I4LUN9_9FIRM|nr:hypothetical protein [Pelosinus propionicus]SFL94788.1 hypothetical protein SAMN04490355_102736 [Pelosinus propionicus DSM 13327]
MNEKEEIALKESKYPLTILIIVAVVSLLTGNVTGLTLGYILGESDRQALAIERSKPPGIRETIKTITDSKFQYIPGETVYLPGEVKEVLVVPADKDTPGANPVKLDGKFDLGKQNFMYMINGRIGKFDKTEDEKFVFEKNMIDLRQNSTIVIKAEIPTIDLTRQNVITVGAMFTQGRIEPGIGYTSNFGRVGAYQLAGSQSAAYIGAGFKF